MVFGFDLDSTLFNCDSSWYAAQMLGQKPRFSKRYDGKDLPKEVYQLSRILYRCPEYMNYLKRKNISFNILEHVARQHTLFIATQRIARLRPGTIEMVQRAFGIVFDDRIFFVDHKEEKIPIIKRMETDYWFDDDPAAINMVREKTEATAVLISDERTPYNYSLARRLRKTVPGPGYSCVVKSVQEFFEQMFGSSII